MAKINTTNYQTVASWNGSQDLFVVEQPDGTKVATPAQIKQYVLGNSIDDIYSVMGQMGAKNLIPYPFKDITNTVNGITFTDNGDGTITASGTASANATFNIRDIWTASDLVELLPNTIYAFSGCPVGGSVSTYLIQFVNEESNLSNKSWLDDTGTGGTITTTDVKRFVGARIVIQSGTVLSTPVTFKPMLRLASDTDNTYRPYAKTNKELTDEIGDLSQTGLTGDSVAAQLTAAKRQIASLQTNRAYHVDVGNVTGNNQYELLGAAFDKLTIYGVPVLVNYSNYGQHLALMFKYNAAGDYGMGIGMRYGTTSIIKMGVNGGTKTYATT